MEHLAAIGSIDTSHTLSAGRVEGRGGPLGPAAVWPCGLEATAPGRAVDRIDHAGQPGRPGVG